MPESTNSRKKLWAILIILFIALTLPVAVFLTQQSQEIRQRAQTPYGTACNNAGGECVPDSWFCRRNLGQYDCPLSDKCAIEISCTSVDPTPGTCPACQGPQSALPQRDTALVSSQPNVLATTTLPLCSGGSCLPNGCDGNDPLCRPVCPVNVTSPCEVVCPDCSNSTACYPDNPVYQCGSGCTVGGNECAGVGLECISGFCRNSSCPTDQNCVCDTTPPLKDCGETCTATDQCKLDLTCAPPNNQGVRVCWASRCGGTTPSPTPTPTPPAGANLQCTGKLAYRDHPNNTPGSYNTDQSLLLPADTYIYVNEIIVYSVLSGNSGDAAASGGTLTDTLPPHVTYMDGDTGCTHNGAATGGTVTCNLGNVPAQTIRNKSYRVRVVSSAAFSNSATTTYTGDVTPGAPLCSIRLVSGSSPVPSPSPTPAPYCADIRLYTVSGAITSASSWNLIDTPAEQQAAYRPGNTIYITVVGASQNAPVTFSRGRIRVNVGSTQGVFSETTSIKPKSLASEPDEYYVSYPIPVNLTATMTFYPQAEVCVLTGSTCNWY